MPCWSHDLLNGKNQIISLCKGKFFLETNFQKYSSCHFFSFQHSNGLRYVKRFMRFILETDPKDLFHNYTAGKHIYFLWVLCDIRLELWLQRIDLCHRNIFCKICQKKDFFSSKKNSRSSTAGWFVKQYLHVAVTNNVFVYLLFVKNTFSFRKKAMI